MGLFSFGAKLVGGLFRSKSKKRARERARKAEQVRQARLEKERARKDRIERERREHEFKVLQAQNAKKSTMAIWIPLAGGVAVLLVVLVLVLGKKRR